MWVLPCNNILYERAEKLFDFINGIIEFSEKYQDEIQSYAATTKTTLLEKISTGYSFGLFPALFFTPINFYYGIHWESPCKPSLAGYWLLPECSALTWNSVLIQGSLQNYLGIGFKFRIFLFNQWAMSFGLYLCLFIVTGLLVPCPFELCKFLDVYYKMCEKAKDSNMVYETGLVYRKIQVLLQLLNHI